MADIPADIGALARKIGDYQITDPAGIRELSELCRIFEVECSEVIGYARFEVFQAVWSADHGSRRRARQVARPLDHAVSLHMMAAKRCVAVYRTFCKAFAEELNAKRAQGRGKRKFDWKA